MCCRQCPGPKSAERRNWAGTTRTPSCACPSRNGIAERNCSYRRGRRFAACLRELSCHRIELTLLISAGDASQPQVIGWSTCLVRSGRRLRDRSLGAWNAFRRKGPASDENDGCDRPAVPQDRWLRGGRGLICRPKSSVDLSVTQERQSQFCLCDPGTRLCRGASGTLPYRPTARHSARRWLRSRQPQLRVLLSRSPRSCRPGTFR